jgi:hypothetical protein
MTYESNQSLPSALVLNAERQYFDSYYQEADEDNEYSTHFDAYSTFDENDYEYQQDLACGRY